MKIRMIETIKHDPRIELMPDSGKFDTLDATITVIFFDWVDGEKVYRPLVWHNISMGKMNPEVAHHWAECLNAAYQIAKRAMPEHIDAKQKDVIVEAWIRVDGIRATLKTHA